MKKLSAYLVASLLLLPIAADAQQELHLSPRVFIRLNNAIGLTSKATDIAPEVGVVFSFTP